MARQRRNNSTSNNADRILSKLRSYFRDIVSNLYCQCYCSLLRCYYSSIAQTIFTNQLKRNLAIEVPNLPATVISALEQSLATLEELDSSVREPVLRAYLHSIAQLFLFGVVASVFIGLCAMYVD